MYVVFRNGQLRRRGPALDLHVVDASVGAQEGSNIGFHSWHRINEDKIIKMIKWMVKHCSKCIREEQVTGDLDIHT